MIERREALEKMGHEIKMPPSKLKDGDGKSLSVSDYYKIRKKGSDEKWVWDRKKESILKHFDKVKWSDVILVLNLEKNNIPGYIGANTLIEMGLALYLDKKIFLYNQIPKMSYQEEIKGMNSIVINKNLDKINL
jgi:hypothetical protein